MQGKVEAHNQRPAVVWSSGGDAYDDISHQIASALEHCVRRIDPQPGERILDLATGTGWTSRLLARRGARVTGADIASDLIAAASARAKADGLEITYEIGDAEKLPYPDASFDAVVSTFGVMFVNRPGLPQPSLPGSAAKADGSVWRPGCRTAASIRCSW